MANKENEALNESESEGDSLSSLKGINEKLTKAKRGASPRTYSTSEVDREQKKSAKIVTEFLTRSPVINSLVSTTRHAPLLSHGPGSDDKDIPVQQTAEMNLDAVCKKKMSRKAAVTRPATFYSPPVRPRPQNDSSPPSRPRSRSVPDYSEIQRYLSDEEESVAKLVGSRLNDIASRMNPRLPYHVYERVLFEAIALALPQTGYQAVPVKVFRHALEMVRRQTSGWTYRSIMDMLFYGRKMFSQFLINFDGDDIDGLRLIDQFVDFFNVQCLPWIRTHGGWGEMLHHSEEGDMASTLETSHEGDQSSGYGSLGQPPIESLDERDNASVTPTVFSSDSDEDNSTLEPAVSLPPVSHSTPARQLSDIPEVESPDASLHLPPKTEENVTPENVPSSMPPTESDPNTSNSSGNNILFYGTTIAVAGALIYSKLN